jgi:Family of unknown function (DUF6178)
MGTSRPEREAKRAQLIRRLVDLAPRRRADALLDEVDGRALVRSIPAEDVYATIVEVGLADCTEIVQLATPDQFRTFVDLAAWQRDRIDPLEVLRWLRAARGDDEEPFMEKLKHLDIEVLELLYKKLTVAHDLEEDPDVNPEGVTLETPEGKFLLEFTVDGVDEAAMRRLTMDLMAANAFELTRFLEAVRWEAPVELEETAFQFRQARLEDLGFPPLEEAMRVFAWLDPETVKGRRPASPGLLAPGTRTDFVGAAFRGLDEVERTNLETEVRGLVNRVMVAQAAEPGDPGALRRASEYARDTLDLGLEHLTGGAPAEAAAVVREHPLVTIFQVGFSITLRLKRRADRLAREEGARFGEAWLALDEEAAALDALALKRPLKAVKVPGAEPVPFRALREVADAEQLLVRVRAQRAVFRSLLGEALGQSVARFGVPLAELRAQRLLAAVVAWAELDGQLTVAPLPVGRLSELCTHLLGPGPGPAPARLTPAAGERALEALRAGLPAEVHAELPSMVQRVLVAMAADLGPTWLATGKVEPARVESLPVGGLLPV